MADDQGEVILQAILEKGFDEFERSTRQAGTPTTAPTPAVDDSPKQDKENHTQWALGGNGRFIPVGSTKALLPPGVYEPFAQPGQWGVERLDISSDDIYLLPDMATEIVLGEVRTFWNSEKKYRAHKLLYKRGLILFGPPGSGKTVAIKLLMQELVRQGGIVLVAQNIGLTVMVLKAIRRIEPKRNLIVVLEDIDEIISANGESVVLSMLDGENNIDNILHVATTNFLGKLGARIVNRPSRFDRCVYVGMPGSEARKTYLEKATNNGLTAELLEVWVKDTEKLSIAHLRELVAAVYCLDQPYDEVLRRLRIMAIPAKDDDGFDHNKLGFAGQGKV